MDKILQQIVWKLTSDDAEKFLLLADIIKGREGTGRGGGVEYVLQHRRNKGGYCRLLSTRC